MQCDEWQSQQNNHAMSLTVSATFFSHICCMLLSSFQILLLRVAD